MGRIIVSMMVVSVVFCIIDGRGIKMVDDESAEVGLNWR